MSWVHDPEHVWIALIGASAAAIVGSCVVFAIVKALLSPIYQVMRRTEAAAESCRLYSNGIARAITDARSIVSQVVDADSGPFWDEILDLRRRVDATPGSPSPASPPPAKPWVARGEQK